MSYKISGILNNCALNTALPIMLDDFKDLAKLEQKNSLPTNCNYFQNYQLLKQTFAEVYEINNDDLKWDDLNRYLQSFKSFLAVQVIFLPVLRKFIGKNADKNYDLTSLTEIQSEGSVEGNQNIGRYNPLDCREALNLLHSKFGINITKVHEKENNQVKQSHTIDICKSEAPAWSTTKLRNLELYLSQGHFEIYDNSQMPENELTNLDNNFKELLAIINKLSNAEETNKNLEHLKRYVNESFKNKAKETITSDTSSSSIGYQIFTSAYFRIFMSCLIIAAALTLTALILSLTDASNCVPAFIINLSPAVYNVLFMASIATVATATTGLAKSFWSKNSDYSNYEIPISLKF